MNEATNTGHWDDEYDWPDESVLESEAEVECPHCGETVSIRVDPGSGTSQEYVEDCPVCCRPWRVRVEYDPDGSAEVWVDEIH